MKPGAWATWWDTGRNQTRLSDDCADCANWQYICGNHERGHCRCCGSENRWRSRAKAGRWMANSADRAMRLGIAGRLRQVIQVNLPGIVEKRYLVLVEKAAATPPKYPRKAGMPMKHPL